jgi:hypothetical protein
MRAILNIRLESDEPSDRAVPVVSAFSRTWAFPVPRKPLQSVQGRKAVQRDPPFEIASYAFDSF